MFGLPGADLLLLAQQENSGSAMLPIYVMGFVAITYFLLLRPQRQQEAKRRAMIDALKKNDKVVTTGGIFGTVTSVDPTTDRVVLRVDDEKGVKLSFTRASVARVIEPSAEKPAAEKPAAEL
jgi:preprotein translocase subunit YajC